MHETMDANVSLKQLRDIQVENLWWCPPVYMDMVTIGEYLAAWKALITDVANPSGRRYAGSQRFLANVHGDFRECGKCPV